MFVLVFFPPQTRCLISPGWVTWRSTPGRTPPSSASPPAKSPRASPSSSRWAPLVSLRSAAVAKTVGQQEEDATKTDEEVFFFSACCAFGWRLRPSRAHSRIICMLSRRPNSHISFYISCSLLKLFFFSLSGRIESRGRRVLRLKYKATPARRWDKVSRQPQPSRRLWLVLLQVCLFFFFNGVSTSRCNSLPPPKQPWKK